MADQTVSTSGMPGLERGLEWCLRHWLLLINIGAALYAGLPWLAPVAQATGHPLLGVLLLRLYAPLCHQKPERSFFLLGHQVGFCHRCAAIYTSVVVAGLLFGLFRRVIPPARLSIAALLLLPMLIDGGTHMLDDLLGLGLRGGGDAIGTPNFWLRMITGALAGVVMLIAVYPRIERDLRQALAPAAGEARV